MSDLYAAAAVDRFEQNIDLWLAHCAATNPAIVAIDRSEDHLRRWHVRLRGEEKEFTTVWLTLGERTLRYEAYVMPAPEENATKLYEQLLRRNERLVGIHFAIGIEDAVFLRGDLPLSALTEAELDRLIGSLFATIEQCYQGLLRIGFASRFPSAQDQRTK